MKKGRKPRHTVALPLAQSWSVPRHLSGAAAAEFKRLVGLLKQRGQLERANREVVIRLAELTAIAQTLFAEISKPGVSLIAMNDQGRVGVHPGVKAHKDIALAIRQISGELGLTPQSARTSPIAGGDATDAKWAHLLAE
jgi:P27 family predicted phage terminase small subunit